MNLTTAQLTGLLISFLGIAGLATFSGSRAKSSSGGAGAPITAGIIMGTLVGGSSTVGTAQLAYNYGLSAWWFTLGGGIACLVLALLYVKPLRHSGSMTLIGMITNEFGSEAGLAASLLNSVGTFINILSQLIAGTAVLTVIAPNMGMIPELTITAAAMVLYVVSGGTQGAGMVGILKLVLLYVSMLGCGAVVLRLTGGLGGFRSMVDGIDNPDGVNFYSLLARGAGKDLGACASLILGVLTTQTYAQAVMTGKSDSSARLGALISAFLIPPIGTGGILVGLYMRANYPDIAAKTALTAFATEHLPGLLSGIVLGTLFIAVVGTGAGLAMGVASILRRDIIQRFTDRFNSAKSGLKLSRLLITAVLALGCLLCTGSLGDTILSFAFMSMGLRGAVVFVPMLCACALPGRVNRRCALAGIIAGPVAVLLFGTVLSLPYGLDPLFAGIAAALICHIIGLVIGNKHEAVTVEHPEYKTPSDFTVVIDSELYSHADRIAALLAQKLALPLYGDEILREASRLSGIPEALFNRFDGSPVTGELCTDGGAAELIPAAELVRAQTNACLSLAERGSCVFVGRFATNAMEGNHNCVSVFIHADFEKRAETCSEELGLGPALSRRILRMADRSRESYYRSYSPRWGHQQYYTFSVSSDNAEPEEIAETLINDIRSYIIDPGMRIKQL